MSMLHAAARPPCHPPLCRFTSCIPCRLDSVPLEFCHHNVRAGVVRTHLLLVVRPGGPSSFLFLIAMPLAGAHITTQVNRTLSEQMPGDMSEHVSDLASGHMSRLPHLAAFVDNMSKHIYTRMDARTSGREQI